jgi:hypothetical protein
VLRIDLSKGRPSSPDTAIAIPVTIEKTTENKKYLKIKNSWCLERAPIDTKA